MKHAICESCGDPFAAENPVITTCGELDCSKIKLIKRLPELGHESGPLYLLAKEYGIHVELMPGGGYRIVQMTDTEGSEWREDKRKILTRAERDGLEMSDEYAWLLAARAAAKRAGAPYQVKRPEPQELQPHGEVRVTTHRKVHQEPETKDGASRSRRLPHLGQFKRRHLPQAVRSL